MTERTPISLGLVMTIVGAVVMIVGAFVWLQADIRTLQSQMKEHEDVAKRMTRLEMLMCVTDDAARARACQQLGVMQ